MVAVSGFRINEQTIVSTRVTPADAKQTLLRTHSVLPFREKTTRWRVQTYVQNNKAVFQLDGVSHVLSIKEKTEKTFADRLGIMILQLQKPATGQLKLEQVIAPMKMPRGQPASATEPGLAATGYKKLCRDRCQGRSQERGQKIWRFNLKCVENFNPVQLTCNCLEL